MMNRRSFATASDRQARSWQARSWQARSRRLGHAFSLAVLVAGGGSGAVAQGAPIAVEPVVGAHDKTAVHRFALITGASKGGADRVPLRFAASDAHAMRHVLSDLGGLGESETVVLLEVGREALRGGFDRVKQMVAAARAPGARSEMIFYYSGHSDETGLLLGNERVSYAEVRAWVDDTGADVRIAVLDSCASGAMTRGKGGVRRPPFLVDTSSAARGHAYLTASAENEAAQESDRLGAAYFTHYLVSGLRGAADVSHDGRVTLSEAYQYAFTETLARTQESRGGPQHASYDFQLAGKGDLVMTDLRATSASLLLPPELSGRLFVRDAQGQLIAEVHKLPAQPIELGLPPGRYHLTLDDNRRLSETTIDLIAGQRNALNPSLLIALAPTPSRSRGADGVDGAADGQPTTLSLTPPNDLLPPPRASHVNLSIFPGFDTNGGIPSDDTVVFGFFARSRSLNGAAVTLGDQVLGNVSGTQIAAIGHLVGGDVKGTQLAGLANVVGGSLTGFEAAGITNWVRGPMDGAQIAGINNGAAGGRGLQISGVTNFSARAYLGLQATGVANIANESFEGAQLAGAVNFTRQSVHGAQIAGAVNVARLLEGAQIGVVNVGGDVTGAQIGVVNVARHVRGTQIGLVDIADDADGAAPIGLVTFVRNGIHEVELSTNEALSPVLSGVLGTHHVFTRLGVGLLASPSDIPGGRAVTLGSPDDRRRLFWQWGFGGRVDLRDKWFVDIEAIGWQLTRGNSGSASWRGVSASLAIGDSSGADAVLASARALVGYRLAPHLTLVFGPSYNVGVGWNGADPVTGSGFAEAVHRSGATTVRMYPGAMLGMRI